MQSISSLSASLTVAPLKKDTLLRSLLRQPAPQTPVEALQENLVSAVLLATPAKVFCEARLVLDDFGLLKDGVGHLFNLGH